MTSYGWTIEQVDSLTVPQFIGLMEQVKKYPPPGVILSEFLREMPKARDRVNEEAINKIPYVSEPIKKGGKANKSYFSKNGNRILKMVSKRTGERII